jgi:prophage DNA circulation protein
MDNPWRKQLLPGSYKKVPFLTDSHEFTGGKRIVDHIFPYRDLAFTESLGRRQRVFSLDAYVLGEDYFKARNDLIAALESDGAGTLVHPYLGTKTVEAVDFRVNESKTDGGIVYFQITFHETAARPSADIAVDVIQKAAIQNQKISRSLVTEFGRFIAKGLSDLNVNRLADYVDKATDAIYQVRDFIPAGDFGLSNLAFGIRNAKTGIRSLLLRPMQMADFVTDSFRLLLGSLTLDGINPLRSAGTDPSSDPAAFKAALYESRTKRSALKAAVDIDQRLPVYLGDTESKIQMRENRRVLINIVKGNALAALAIVSMQTVYGTFNEALEQREYLISEIEKLLADPLISDEVYQDFQDLIVLIVQGVPGEFTSEARLSLVEVTVPTPSLTLAYDLYESLQLESDIISRNRVPNPAFIRPGKVEVISGD